MAEEQLSIWDRHAKRLRKHLKGKDLENFLSWPVINGTMFVGDAPYIKSTLDTLMESDDWPRYQHAIKESWVGNPKPCEWYPDSTGNLIRQCNYIMEWERASGKNVEDLDTIVEIGAGYGAMPYIINQLGFKGDYYIIDIPEMVEIQEHYLWESGVGMHVAWNEYPDDADLLIALFSLSELKLEQKLNIFHEILDYKSFIFAYQNVWLQSNNIELFDEFRISRNDLSWTATKNEPMVTCNRLIGY